MNGIARVAALVGVALMATSTAALERKDVAGRSIVRSEADGRRATERYHHDGTLTVQSTRADGSCCVTDSGQWWIQDGKLCRLYPLLNGGNAVCRDGM